jgi:hypothetical protein
MKTKKVPTVATLHVIARLVAQNQTYVGNIDMTRLPDDGEDSIGVKIILKKDGTYSIVDTTGVAYQCYITHPLQFSKNMLLGRVG